METLIIDIPEKKSKLVKQLLKELGVGIRPTELAPSTKLNEGNTVIKIADESKDILRSIENGTYKHPAPPKGKKTSAKEILKDFGKDPNFPSIEEIRDKAWSKKW